MSEEKNPFSDENPMWEDSEETTKEIIYEQQIESTSYEEMPLQQEQSFEEMDPELEVKKKRRRKIYIIVFAIILPIVIVLSAGGLLIWGLVVGFTQCINSCESCFSECFSCCNACEDCGNTCSGCSDTCTNCCGSSESISQRTSEAIIKTQSTIKLFFQNSIAMIKWCYYRMIQIIQMMLKR
jgi:hypothetical protein